MKCISAGTHNTTHADQVKSVIGLHNTCQGFELGFYLIALTGRATLLRGRLGEREIGLHLERKGGKVVDEKETEEVKNRELEKLHSNDELFVC